MMAGVMGLALSSNLLPFLMSHDLLAVFPAGNAQQVLRKGQCGWLD